MKVTLCVCALDHVDDLCEPCALQRGCCDVGESAGSDLCQRLKKPVEPVFFRECDLVDNDGPWVVSATGFDCAGSGEHLVDPSFGRWVSGGLGAAGGAVLELKPCPAGFLTPNMRSLSLAILIFGYPACSANGVVRSQSMTALEALTTSCARSRPVPAAGLSVAGGIAGRLATRGARTVHEDEVSARDACDCECRDKL